MRPVSLLLLLLSTSINAAERVDVRFVPDEARAVLTILDARASGKLVTRAMWQRVFASEGYVRLKKREHSMQREFEDKAFAEFVMSDDLLAKREQLRHTLDSWLAADLGNAAAKALAYLPANAKIRAKVYPVIKPKTNSFVFEVGTDPAIFMYVGDVPREEFEATIAHEMHHIGYGTACKDDGPPLPDNLKKLETWIGGFGEGFATLAAAGGPEGNPQHRADARAEWEKQIPRFDANFNDVVRFFTEVLEGKLTGEAADKKAFEFFGLVGPWYTVGWKMAVVIEKTLGRDALVAAMCDHRHFLGIYNRAAEMSREKLPRWPDALARAFD